MELPSQHRRKTKVIAVQSHENVLAAFPYGPHSSLLDFLKGEPKVLGAVQILLALIIVGLGIIFAFSYIDLSKIFPLVFLSGYPFWGSFIFLFTGSLTLINEKFRNSQARGVLAMNIVSSVVAVIGIIFILISYTQQNKFCQTLSSQGTCVLGRTLYIGILSVLLILSIVELSISVTIASFGSNCWAKSHEVVFFLPSDVIQGGQRPAQDEHDQLEFELQEELSSNAITPNIQTVFFGGYAFFKLRVSRGPVACQCLTCAHNKDRDGFYTPCVPISEAIQESIPPPFIFSEEEIEEPKLLLPSLENIYAQPESGIKQLDDEDLQYTIAQPINMQDPLSQDYPSPPKVIPLPRAQIFQAMLPEYLPSQIQLTQAQDVQSKSPSFHVTQSYDQTCGDSPSQDVLTQDKPTRDVSLQTPSEQVILQPSTDQDSQSVQPLNLQSSEIIYRDIRTEVVDETQNWSYKKGNYGKKSPRRLSLEKDSTSRQTPRRLSLELPNKRGQSPKRHSLDQQSKGAESPRRRSLEQQIKALLSLKKRSLEKQVTAQLPDQQPKEEQSPKQSQTKTSQDQQAIEEETPPQQAIEEETPPQQAKEEETQMQDQKAEDQQAPEEKTPNEQFPNWQARDQPPQVEKSPKPLLQDSLFQIHKEQEPHETQEKEFAYWTTPNWQSLGHRSQDWIIQGWRNKDWKAQEWQCDMQQSQSWDTQELLEKEALRQKALYQEVQTPTTTAQQKLDFQNQENNQEDSQSRSTLKENMQIDIMQKRSIKLGRDRNWREQSPPSDLASEDRNTEWHPSSCQSLVQDNYLTCLSDIGSEPEDANLTPTSLDPKDQQQSDDSD